MKKSVILSAIVAALIGVTVSCDKIPENEYIIPAGASGEWHQSSVSIPTTQRAFVEKYTGVRCTNCPKADEVLHSAAEKYGDRLVVVAVHSGVFGNPFSGEPDLRIEDGMAWFDYFGIRGQPSALVNRGKVSGAWDIFSPINNFDDRIDAAVGVSPKVAMMVKSNENKFADIHMRFDETIEEPLTLTVLLTEDKIYTTQSSMSEGQISDYEQNHVLRALITDTWGFDVNHATTGGTQAMVQFLYELPEVCNAENCHLVAFLSYKDSREIINSAQCDLAGAEK